MNEDQVKGKVKDIGGRVERQVGEWTGDQEKQSKGALKQAEGKVQKAWGDVKDAGKKAMDDARKPKGDGGEVEETDVHTTRRKAS